MRKIVFIRHGKASAAAPGARDFIRDLSQVGIDQATARCDKMNGTKFNLVLSSPAPRALKTGSIVSGKPENEIMVVEALYPNPHDGGIGTRLDAIFNRLGYAPVSTYLKETDGEVVMDWAGIAWQMCESEIDANGNADVIAVFGHAVCLPALGMILCEGEEHLVEQIAEMNLGECDGFVVNIHDGRPVSIELVRD